MRAAAGADASAEMAEAEAEDLHTADASQAEEAGASGDSVTTSVRGERRNNFVEQFLYCTRVLRRKVSCIGEEIIFFHAAKCVMGEPGYSSIMI